MTPANAGPRPPPPPTHRPMARKAKAAPTAAEFLDPVETFLDRGQLAPATAALLPALERRAESGDRACALAVRLLRASPIAEAALPRPPDAVAAALERLVDLVGRQQEQITALRAMVEDELLAGASSPGRSPPPGRSSSTPQARSPPVPASSSAS